MDRGIAFEDGGGACDAMDEDSVHCLEKERLGRIDLSRTFTPKHENVESRFRVSLAGSALRLLQAATVPRFCGAEE